MPRYVIERHIPGIGKLSHEELQAISRKSCDVVASIGGRIQWVESFVTADKIYCVYIAANEQLIRDHARAGGFPIAQISEVMAVIDPATSEGDRVRRA
jgi:hypothetical protein